MTRSQKWSVVVALLLGGAVLSGGCRNRPTPPGATPAATSAATQTAIVEVKVQQVTVEVTRVVVETQIVEITAEPEPTQVPPIELVVCLAQEPATLYPYGQARQSVAATHVHQAIFENLFTTRGFGYQARGIEKLPNFADGDAESRTVEVRAGDLVYDTKGDVVTLRPGVQVKTVDGEIISYENTPVSLPQLVVRYQLKPLVWSDGTPVTADDSVYSFELAADPTALAPAFKVDRTASYVATGERTLEWTSVPGYMDAAYFTNIWTPYPRHLWEEFTGQELLELDPVSSMPLSHGPFILQEWVRGDHLTMVRNEHYYLADAGMPKVDVVRFDFVPNHNQLLARLLSGQCHIATHESIGMDEWPFLIDAEESGLLAPHFQSGTVFEHIDFGINPVEEYTTIRPDWFEDVRVRQAIVLCTDRQGMVDDILFGRAEVAHAYVAISHPLYPADAVEWPHDVAAANELLDAAGYIDRDEDGFRNDPFTGAHVRMKLLSALGNRIAERVATAFRDDLAQCGIEVEPEFLNNELFFADGPAGPLFGRRFDLGAFPWLIGNEPNCGLYLSARIPGPENNWNRSYNNEIGFRSAEFDAACNKALDSLPGLDDAEGPYESGHREAIRIWTERVPSIPLFMRLNVAVTRPEVTNFAPDSSQPSELWNLYELDLAQ